MLVNLSFWYISVLLSYPKNSAYANAGYTLCDFNNRIRAQQTPLYDMNLVNLQVRKKINRKLSVCLGLVPVLRWSVHHLILHIHWLLSWRMSHCAIVIPNFWLCQNVIAGYLWFRRHDRYPWTRLTVQSRTTILEPRPKILPHFSHDAYLFTPDGQKSHSVHRAKVTRDCWWRLPFLRERRV